MRLDERLLILDIIRIICPKAKDNIEEFLLKHPDINKKLENILFIIIYIVLFINIFIYLPYSLFEEYALNHCSWDISKFNLISETVIIILSILLFMELIVCKINFAIINEKKVNPTVKNIYNKLSPFMDFMGWMLTGFIFLSLMYYFMALIYDTPSHKKYIMNCSANISKDNKILFDTKEKKIFRKNQTAEYTNNISNYFLINWNPPKVPKNKGVEIVVRISKDGQLLKYEIQDSSGIKDFDESAINVIKSKEIYKPLPESLKVKYIDFMFGFEIYRNKKYVGEYQISCKTCDNPYKDDWRFY